MYDAVGPGKGELFRASETEEAVNLPPEAQISMSRSTFDQQHEYQQPHILGSNPRYRGLTVPNNNTGILIQITLGIFVSTSILLACNIIIVVSLTQIKIFCIFGLNKLTTVTETLSL